MPRNIVTTTKEVHHEVSPTFLTITAHPLRDLPIHRTPSLPVGICYAMWLMQHVFESVHESMGKTYIYIYIYIYIHIYYNISIYYNIGLVDHLLNKMHIHPGVGKLPD